MSALEHFLIHFLIICIISDYIICIILDYIIYTLMKICWTARFFVYEFLNILNLGNLNLKEEILYPNFSCLYLYKKDN